MWIYRTAKFDNDVKTFGLESIVDSKNNRIQAAKTRAMASLVGRPYAGFIRVRHDNFRIIGGVETVDEKEFFVWYEVLARGSREYRDFPQHSTTIARIANLPEVKEWVRAKSEEEIEASRPPDLPADLLPWFESIRMIYSAQDEDDVLLYETSRWSEDMLTLSGDRERWPTILELTSKAVAELSSERSDASAEVSRFVGNGFTVFAQKVGHKRIFLLGVHRATSPDPVPSSVSLDPTIHIKDARRAYPDWVMADDTKWFDIQKGEAYNLALSPEEHDLLLRLAGQTSAGDELPVFINGQAGSGKSTMLAFAFAGLCKIRKSRAAAGRPLFLTVNESLLTRARETTQQILRGHFSDDESYEDIDLDGLFASLQSYLLSLLDNDGRRRFPPERRVDFNDVAMAWAGTRGKLPVLAARRSHSAEMVWYVIRSLIKGADSGGELDPDGYAEEIEKKERIVSTDDFRAIYDDYYLQWYSPALRDNDLWDDQDLTQAALDAIEAGAPTKDIAALVIDEAQDLTRRELRMVTRATVYSHYALPNLGRPTRPPLILAGDPLQTLSPTGFRWAAVRAGIREELEGLFGAGRVPTPVLLDLHNNYRSAKEIVALANTVQLWRARLFGLEELHPQGAWNPAEHSGRLRLFNIEEVDVEKFIHVSSKTPFIIPCEEGGEANFVMNDPLLSRMHPTAGTPNWEGNVHSAASVKGLEFEKVILYKFGSALPHLEWNPPNRSRHNLQAEYFFNKLYVALTRAIRELYIADTPTGDNLWARFTGPSVRQLLTDVEANNPTVYFSDSDTIDELNLGIFDLDEVEDKNPTATAIQLRDAAANRKSPRQYRQAAHYFRLAGDRRSAEECEGSALDLEGDHLGAGHRYEAASKRQDAWRCYWQAGALIELGDMATQPGELPAVQVAGVEFMITESRDAADIVRLSSAIGTEVSRLRTSDSQWKRIVATLCSDADRIDTSVDNDTISAIADFLRSLDEAGFVNAGIPAAKLSLRAGNRLAAREITERHHMAHPTNDTARLMAQLDGEPMGLRHLVAHGLHGEAIDRWNVAGRPYTSDWMDHLLPALAGPDYLTDRIDYFLATDDPSKAAEAFLSSSRTQTLRQDVVERIVGSFGSGRRPDEGYDFIEDVAKARLPNPGRRIMQLRLIRDLGIAMEKSGGGAPQSELDNLNSALAALGEFLLPRDGRRADKRATLFGYDKGGEFAPAYGLLLEAVGEQIQACRIYKHYAGAADQSLRDYCRHRYLAQATAHLKASRPGDRGRVEFQNERQELAKAWRLDVDQSSHVAVATLEVRPTVVEQPEPTGARAAVSWAYQDKRQQLQVTFDDGEDLLVISRIALVGDGHVPAQAALELTDGGVRLTAGAYTVTVHTGSDVRLWVVRDGIEEGSALVTRRAAGQPTKESGRPGKTARTAGGGREGRTRQPAFESSLGPLRQSGIKAYKLAEDLGLSLVQLQALCVGLNFKPYRGADNIPFVVSIAIREAHFANGGTEPA